MNSVRKESKHFKVITFKGTMRRKQPILLMQQGNLSVAKTIVTYFEKKVCRYTNISAKPNSQLNSHFQKKLERSQTLNLCTYSWIQIFLTTSLISELSCEDHSPFSHPERV